MTANNVETTFRLPSGVTPTTTAPRKYKPTAINTKYQPIHISFTKSSYVRNVIWKCVA